MQRGAAFVASRMPAAAGREVVYYRGSQTVRLTGWPDKQEYEVIDEETGLPLRVTYYDWTFTASELVFSGDTERVKCRPGDQILETLNSEERIYEAMPPGKKPVSEDLDSAGVIIKVHCKLVQCRPS